MIRLKVWVQELGDKIAWEEEYLVSPDKIAAIRFRPARYYEDHKRLVWPAAAIVMLTLDIWLEVRDPPSIDRLLELERS